MPAADPTWDRESMLTRPVHEYLEALERCPWTSEPEIVAKWTFTMDIARNCFQRFRSTSHAMSMPCYLIRAVP